MVTGFTTQAKRSQRVADVAYSWRLLVTSDEVKPELINHERPCHIRPDGELHPHPACAHLPT